LLDTPIYSALKKYIGENNIRMHMPGHIGIGMTAEELKSVSLLDVTEVPGLDDLHLSREVIEDSRQLLARAFGAGESFFLVNGATSGIEALFMGLTSDQGKVLVPRNAHRSFFAGMVLSGAMPVYIPVQVEKELGITLAVKPQDVEDLISVNQDAEAVFVTSPSYYGTTCHIDEIAAIAKYFSKVLAIDEAHGAHFPFNKLYPVPALQAGADAVVNGLHKTLPVLNQGACMHIANSLVNNQRIGAAYSLLTTTSPSYPIMASIDLARHFMEENGENLLGKAWQLSIEFREKINRIKGIKCYGEELKSITGVQDIDYLKVLISVKGTGLTGYEAAALLRQDYQIQIELAETNIILAMVSMFHKREDWERLYTSLNDIAGRYSSSDRLGVIVEVPPYPQVVLSPRQAFLARKKRVLLKESLNIENQHLDSHCKRGMRYN
jgi:lysine decarboxylase